MNSMRRADQLVPVFAMLLSACSSQERFDTGYEGTRNIGAPDASTFGDAMGGPLGPPDVTVPPDPPDAGPAFSYEITVADPENRLTAAHASMVACMEGALDEWGRYLSGAGTLTVEIHVAGSQTGRMAGGSVSATGVGSCKNIPPPCNLVEEQAGTRLRTGASNPASPIDVRITVPPAYWNDEVWVDPTPKARTEPPANNRLDCVSLFVHEVGHALGFNGRRSLTDFSPAANGFSSQYDDLVFVRNGLPMFEGPSTLERFGPIPVTHTSPTQNLSHYGDPSTPSPFDENIMNGIVFRYGKRYYVGFVDVSILEDLRLPIRAYPRGL